MLVVCIKRDTPNVVVNVPTKLSDADRLHSAYVTLSAFDRTERVPPTIFGVFITNAYHLLS